MSSGGRTDALPRGFTLVELVVCIVLAAIVASFIVLFLDAPVQEYFQQTSRADLIDSADRVAAAVTADVRTALPNSLRSKSNATATLVSLEFLQTEGTARYYAGGDTAGQKQELTTGQPTTGFDTMDSFGAIGNPVPYLSVGNLGIANHDAYASPSGTLTPRRTRVTVLGLPPASSGEDQVSVTPSMTFVQDPVSLPAVHNAYPVTGPVSYLCDKTAGTLVRYSGYAITAAQALPPAGGTRALIAHDVASCSMSIFKDPGNPGYRFGEVAILNVTLSSGGESFQLFLEAPTEYNR